VESALVFKIVFKISTN